MTETEIIELVSDILKAFWKKFDFWIFLVLTIGSLYFAIRAFFEARKAKDAAHEAGKTVKIQTITIELSEVINRLERLDTEIDFYTARELFSETNRRVRRLIAPFREEAIYENLINLIMNILSSIKANLKQVKPIDPEQVIVDNAVYNAVESDFSDLSGQLAELMGKFEERTIDYK